VVGGDGTIHEAAGGIIQANLQAGAQAGVGMPLGIVPAGSGNDYAYRALRLPQDTLAALDLALTGAPVAVDVGIVNGRYFVNALGVGLDANIAATAERYKRVPLLNGQTLYWTASLSELLLRYNHCPELAISLDGEPLERRLYALAAISLGPTYGGGFAINPDASVTDGLFNLCAIWKPSLPRALRLLPMVERGQHLAQPEVQRRLVRRVVMEAAQPIHAHLDGEVISGSRFEARILPGALLVRGARPV
ncbi:MAG: YegS/Rv2252/BmrU family lipid kinase, partial [Ktedonobacterales bacterium]